MSNERTKQVNARITPFEHAKLRQAAAMDGVTVGTFVRSAIEARIQERAKARPRMEWHADRQCFVLTEPGSAYGSTFVPGVVLDPADE